MKEFKQGSPRARDCGQRIQMGDWLPKDSPDGVGRPFGAVWSVIPTVAESDGHCNLKKRPGCRFAADAAIANPWLNLLLPAGAARRSDPGYQLMHTPQPPSRNVRQFRCRLAFRGSLAIAIAITSGLTGRLQL